MKTIILPATDDNLNKALDFVNEELKSFDAPIRVEIQIAIAVEEIFVNIAHYAYAPNIGEVRIDVLADEAQIKISFSDEGVPYNPLIRPDPDITLSAEDRKIGGLGIYMVKKSMDNIEYKYLDGKNILTIEKKY